MSGAGSRWLLGIVPLILLAGLLWVIVQSDITETVRGDAPPVEDVVFDRLRLDDDGIEVTARSPHFDPKDGVDAARRAADAVRSHGVEVVAYGSYLGRRPAQAEEARHEVLLAAALGAPRIRVWAEATGDDPEDMRACTEVLRAACDAAAKRGIDVVVERHRGSFADTYARIASLFAGVDRPNVGLNYQPLDFLPAEAAAAQADDARELAPWIRYVHLKNYTRHHDEGGPLMLGGSLEDGALDYRSILPAIVSSGYDGPLTIEFLAFDERPVEEKLAADVAFVRDVLGKAHG